ncbi:MAG TPA: T9SS type A sorting domain-containing protein [Bacteroidia bacterium]|nr:T9SS type A sorting domain-containing protein [Bacteroidia bacterium]
MKSKLLTCCICLYAFIIFILPEKIFSQNPARIWYFGQNAGLNFNSGSPVVLSNGQLSTQEGCATITDVSGALLFYTDGITVWNKNHQVMTNGTGLAGGWSTTQSALIVPRPGSVVLFYIFTIEDQSMPGNFSYSIVDMSLQGGLGQVTVKNALIASNITERIAAVKDASGTNAWVVVHERGSNNLQAWSLSSSGIAGSPVISAAGDPVMIYDDYIGHLKFSPDGNKIATTFSFDNFINLFDFDASTGIISNARHLDVPPAFYGVYGLEFSPSSQFLYATPLTASGIYQWDVTLSGAAAINSSIQQIGFAPGGFSGSLQLGPDNKIYIAEYNVTSLGRINQPDNGGMSCNYVAGAVSTGSATVTLGLPGYVMTFTSTPLPVTLVSFYGEVFNSKNILSWTTAIEKNNHFFSLQRSSDGTCFETIGRINGAGNSTQTLKYSFIDGNPAAGINYYRLEQTDYNGKTSLSNTIALRNWVEHSDGFTLFPNPATDFVNVLSENDDDEIEILNGSCSSVIKTRSKNKIDISGLKNGIYFLRVNSAKNYTAQKLIVQK